MNKTCRKIPRSAWIRALKLVPVDEIKALIDAVINEYQVSYKSIPQTGLGVLQTKDTAMHEPYFLGEFPIAISWVVLTDKQGKTFEGAAQLMDDDQNLASLLAVCDAILANDLMACSKLSDLLERGEFKFEQEALTRKAMLGSTVVDFSLLGATNEKENKSV
ncbi:putative PhnG protein [Psychromonas ingrahamii 37]|uniref:Putative PhnG protein n=1 Tax=Psychromonas ingrahamii (strain DSM 17664 / CCUG 51855 / 37) TaxID=357804 RepID=A1T0V4_PSYIN|nr:phosphonate C-P lyase system protein PhnG [Psychromonas ingrahamii]ABM05369.1 putative PhnG protein [Psychromonas ingrahamii 37]